MKIGVNGRFLVARPTGVQRVARELVGRLADRADVTLHVPRGCVVPEDLRARTRVRRGALRGPLWEQLELPLRARAGGIELDPANAGPLLGGRRVLLLHDVLPLTHDDAYTPAFRRWFRHVVGRAARRAALVVLFSEWGRDEAIRHLGLKRDRTAVIGQGVEPFDAPADPADVRRTLARFGIEGPFILAPGTGDPRKGGAFLRTVVEGLGEPPAGAPRPTLVLVGAPYGHVHAPADGQAHAGAEVRAEVPPAGPAPDGRPAIRTLGHVSDDELRALYSAARVFCFPSAAEGFGRPPLEAMACGAPVLAGDYGAAPEVLEGAATLLPRDPARWRSALRAFLYDDALAARAAQAGRRHAAGFRWDAAADRLLALCRRVAAEG